MRPKVEAMLDFLNGGGKEALLTSPTQLAAALSGTAGTRIVPGTAPAP
jgi:carbamate kinase